jgi:hypothetical protein
MDATEPPARPTLEQYEKLAEDFVNAYTSGDSEALRRIKDHYELPRLPTREELRLHAHQRLSKLRKSEGLSAHFVLADARDLIASSQGFESWQALADHIEQMNQDRFPASQFESAVDAVITGDIATLKLLLRDNPNLIRERSTRQHHATLLHYISANGVEDFRQKTPKNAVEVAKLLLASGAEVDAVQADGQSTTLGLVATSVHPLLAGVQIALLETLLDTGAAVDGAPEGWNPLIAALHNGRGEAAEFLATNGARLDLEGAAGVGRLDLVKSFFDEDGGLKATATKAQLESGFAWACEYGRTSVVEFLLENGIEVDARLRHHGQAGLHWAAYGAHLDTVKLLLERKAPVDLKDKSFGGTPLGWALYGWGEPAPEGQRANYYDVVELLVAAGATVDPEWLADPDREMPLVEKVRADPRMLAALGGEMPG